MQVLAIKRTRSGRGLLVVLLAIGLAPLAAETRVYRCIGSDGAVELRQRPCPEGTEEDQILVDDRKIGWDPSATAKGEKPKGMGGSDKPRRNAQKPKESSAKARREDECRKKRQLLEEVNWKLRRGSKPGKGVELRHKRHVYEDYLRDHCP